MIHLADCFVRTCGEGLDASGQSYLEYTSCSIAVRSYQLPSKRIKDMCSIYIPVAVITLLLLVVRAKTWLFWNDQLFRGRGQLAPVFLKGLRLGLGAWDLEAQIALGVIENSEHRMVYAVG